MTQRTVNDRQQQVLSWIGDGCPDGVMPDDTYKATAVALRNRRLVEVTKKRGVWSAVLTVAGRHFLDTGAYPDGHWEPPARVRRTYAGSWAPPREVTGLRPVDQLIADVTGSPDGQVVRSEGSRGYWENLASSAIRHGKVPNGKTITVTTTGRDGTVITLTDARSGPSGGREPVVVADALRRPHPTVAALIKDPRLPGTKPVRQRALRILDAIAKEAERRGYDVHAPAAPAGYTRAKGLLTLTIGGHEEVIDVNELSDRVPHVPTAAERAHLQRFPHSTSVPTHDQIPSGRLRLRILTGWPRKDITDTKTLRLEDRLDTLFQEIDTRAATAERQALQRERDRIARQARWERVAADARIQAREQHRADHLTDEMGAWRQAREIDDYVTALTKHVATLTGAQRDDADAWLEWIRAYRATIDPLANPLRIPEEPEYTADMLRSHMRGLSPYGPDAW